MLKYRRRVPRQPVAWDGICNVEGESAEWLECRILDISMLGLGLTFKHSSPTTLMGRRISIYVPAPDGSVSIRLDGEITNAGQLLGGAVRVGIKFDGLLGDSDTDIAALYASTTGELNVNAGRHVRR